MSSLCRPASNRCCKLALDKSGQAAQIAARNPDEPLRQFASALLARLEATRNSGGGVATRQRRFALIWRAVSVLEAIGGVGSQAFRPAAALASRKFRLPYGLARHPAELHGGQPGAGRTVCRCKSRPIRSQPATPQWSARIRAASQAGRAARGRPGRLRRRRASCFDIRGHPRIPGGTGMHAASAAFVLGDDALGQGPARGLSAAQYCGLSTAPGGGTIRLRIVPLSRPSPICRPPLTS